LTKLRPQIGGLFTGEHCITTIIATIAAAVGTILSLIHGWLVKNTYLVKICILGMKMPITL